MPTVAIAQGLYVWTITLENGEVRTCAGSSLDTLISGNLPSPVVSATRGAALVPGGGPTPVISSLNPDTAVLGAPNFTLHVLGSNFGPGALIVFAGQDEPTTFVSPTELTTLINMAVWLGVDPAIPVYVRSLSGQQSNIETFAFTATAAEE